MSGKLEFHHTDYDRDEGRTVCKKCHYKVEQADLSNEEKKLEEYPSGHKLAVTSSGS